ncbi:tryptophan-rich sensory protein [Rhodococcus ruber]|uniref:tryptophan-rich sensory protein n=2 Tax=Rhodococcus ruber TaxID=1830 RepID=UPI000E6AFFBC|nr:tryptophan-rich sensory protein [Rhodococcus ruber]UQB74712.1 tryptophan-rich sensory protein [Rhodococcus ruber]
MTTFPASSTRPQATSSDRLRVAGVAVSAIAAVALSFLGSGAVVGTPISEVADGALSADATAVAPGGPAFAIWSVIYAGLLALAVWQALPAHHADPRQRALGWWIAASMLLNAAWILVVQLELLALSVAVIVALLAVLVRIFLGLTRTAPSSRVEAVVVDGTMFLYLGWVAVATVANTAAALRAADVDPFSLGADAWAVIVLVAVAAVSVLLAIAGHGRLAVAAAMAWGLVWIAVARSGDTGFTSVPAAVAAGGAAAVAVLSAVIVRLRTEAARRRRTDTARRRRT